MRSIAREIASYENSEDQSLTKMAKFVDKIAKMGKEEINDHEEYWSELKKRLEPVLELDNMPIAYKSLK